MQTLIRFPCLRGTKKTQESHQHKRYIVSRLQQQPKACFPHEVACQQMLLSKDDRNHETSLTAKQSFSRGRLSAELD
jgi:hypothetical protein